MPEAGPECGSVLTAGAALYPQHCAAASYSICVCVYIYIYRYTCVYVYTYMDVYIHMYMCIHTQLLGTMSILPFNLMF